MFKKLKLTFITLSCLLMALTACTQKAQPITEEVGGPVKDTPVLVGTKGQISMSIQGFSFKDAFKEADLIAKVKINGWLGETDEPSQKTFFNASVEEIYKNIDKSEIKKIKLIQQGNSKYTIENFPLFKNGDSLLLFLKKSPEESNTYFIVGVHQLVFKLFSVDHNSYVAKVLGTYSELNSISIQDEKEKETVKDKMGVSQLPQVFKKEKFIKYLLELK